MLNFEDFPVYMNSSASTPGGTAANYTVRLKAPLVVDDRQQYEVCLRQVSMPSQIKGGKEATTLTVSVWNMKSKKWVSFKSDPSSIDTEDNDFNKIMTFLSLELTNLRIQFIRRDPSDDSLKDLGIVNFDIFKWEKDADTGHYVGTFGITYTHPFIKDSDGYIKTTFVPPKLSQTGLFREIMGGSPTIDLGKKDMDGQIPFFYIKTYPGTTPGNVAREKSFTVNKYMTNGKLFMLKKNIANFSKGTFTGWYDSGVSPAAIVELLRNTNYEMKWPDKRGIDASNTPGYTQVFPPVHSDRKTPGMMRVTMSTETADYQALSAGDPLVDMTFDWGYLEMCGFPLGSKTKTITLKKPMNNEPGVDDVQWGNGGLFNNEQYVLGQSGHGTLDWIYRWKRITRPLDKNLHGHNNVPVIQFDIPLPYLQTYDEGYTSKATYYATYYATNYYASLAHYDWRSPPVDRALAEKAVEGIRGGRSYNFDVKLTDQSGNSLVDEPMSNYLGQREGVIRHVYKVQEPGDRSKRKQWQMGFQTLLYRPLKRRLPPLESLKVQMVSKKTKQELSFKDPDATSACDFHIRKSVIPPDPTMASEFYLDLTVNKDHKFTKIMNLSNGYRVACTGASIPYGYINVYEGEMYMKVNTDVNGEYTGKVVLPEGTYTEESIIVELSSLLLPHNMTITLVNGKVSIQGPASPMAMSEDLCAVLGFGGTEGKKEKVMLVASYRSPATAASHVSLQRGFHTLICYCPFLRETLYANEYVKYLTSITPDFEDTVGANKIYKFEPEQVEYQRLYKNIQPQEKIRVDMTDSLGRPVKYSQLHSDSGGELPTVELHFKYFPEDIQ